ncbi:uncharacterized protein LOC132554992 [Ylistrum balloti]|uniref:uncharacterized protein LOC132554992 n=1 Tax=Ylistrum balloti TaxID=509963 RepID=UPI002905955E|nr:uncharacterized protein LOC132554992 [Ylistrum balloti]
MKCQTHADNNVIMVCQSGQCDTCFVCDKCIAGPHSRHPMATIEDVGTAEKKRLKTLSEDNSKSLEAQKKNMELVDSIKQRIQNSIDAMLSSQEKLRQVLETEDWISIIQEGKRAKRSDTAPEETGILSTSQQSQCSSVSSTEGEVSSDFEGTVYRHKKLETVSSTKLSPDHSITCVAPAERDTLWVIINKEVRLCKKQKLVNSNIKYGKKIRGIAVTNSDKLLTTCTDDKCVRKITSGGKTLFSLNTDPLIPNQLCVASNGDILVTLVSSFVDPLPDTVGVVSRYTPQGKRMVTFERDRFGNSICPKYIAASRVSDMVVVTNLTNKDNDDWFYGHVIVMTGDFQVKFRYLSDGKVIPGNQQYHQDTSTKHFSIGIDIQDNIILGDMKAGCIDIVDKLGQKLQRLGEVSGISYLTVSNDDQLWIGQTTGRVEVYKRV